MARSIACRRTTKMIWSRVMPIPTFLPWLLYFHECTVFSCTVMYNSMYCLCIFKDYYPHWSFHLVSWKWQFPPQMRCVTDGSGWFDPCCPADTGQGWGWLPGPADSNKFGTSGDLYGIGDDDVVHGKRYVNCRRRGAYASPCSDASTNVPDDEEYLT